MVTPCPKRTSQGVVAVRFQLARHTYSGRYIAEMSKFAFRDKSHGNGKITLTEFEEYFAHVADQDTGDAETSPLACKALVALEYVRFHCQSIFHAG